MSLRPKDIIAVALVMVLSTPLVYFVLLLLTGNARIEFGPSDHQEQRGALRTVKSSPLRDSLLARHSKTFQALQKERREVEAERERLAEEEKRLSMIRAEIENERDELRRQRQRLEGLVEEADSLDQRRIKQLARIYGAMRPAEAAQILGTLSDDLVIKIIKAIGDDRQKAKIVAAIPKAKADRITTKMGKPLAEL